MKLQVSSVDYAPKELYGQTPFVVTLVRQLPGPDRPDYWLGEVERPLKWMDGNVEREVTHLIIAARWAGTQIGPNFENLPIGLAFVTDASQVGEPSVDFRKCRYVAIGIAAVVKGGMLA